MLVRSTQQLRPQQSSPFISKISTFPLVYKVIRVLEPVQIYLYNEFLLKFIQCMQNQTLKLSCGVHVIYGLISVTASNKCHGEDTELLVEHRDSSNTWTIKLTI